MKNILLLSIAMIVFSGCKKVSTSCLPCYYFDHFSGIASYNGDSVFTMSIPPHKSSYTTCYDTNTYTPTGPSNLGGYGAQLNSDTLYVSTAAPAPGESKVTSGNTLYCR